MTRRKLESSEDGYCEVEREQVMPFDLSALEGFILFPNPPAINLSEMSLLSRFFYKRPPDGLLEFVDRVYVFDSCFSTEVLPDGIYQMYLHEIVTELHEEFPDSSFLAINFREGEKRSQLAEILCEYDVTVFDYPRQYEGCPLLPLSLIQHFLRLCESWLMCGNHRNIILLHCERGGWPLLAFLLASLLIFRKLHSGERKTLEIVHREAPKGYLQLFSPLNPFPSQLRYLQYVARRNIAPEWPPPERALSLDCVILRAIPSFDSQQGCRPVIRIFGRSLHSKDGFSSKMLFSMAKKKRSIRHYCQADSGVIKIDIQCWVQGDVVLECVHLDLDPEREVMMFRVMFNTAFIRSNILILDPENLDILWDSKEQFPKGFRAEVLFGDIECASPKKVQTTILNGEGKCGLPVDAFSRVQELFNGEWVDNCDDATLWLLKQLSVLSDVKEFSRFQSKTSSYTSPVDSEEENNASSTADSSDEGFDFIHKPLVDPTKLPIPDTGLSLESNGQHDLNFDLGSPNQAAVGDGKSPLQQEVVVVNPSFVQLPDQAPTPPPPPPPPPLLPSISSRIPPSTSASSPSPPHPSPTVPFSIVSNKDSGSSSSPTSTKVSAPKPPPPPPPLPPPHQSFSLKDSSNKDQTNCTGILPPPPPPPPPPPMPSLGITTNKPPLSPALPMSKSAASVPAVPPPPPPPPPPAFRSPNSALTTPASRTPFPPPALPPPPPPPPPAFHNLSTSIAVPAPTNPFPLLPSHVPHSSSNFCNPPVPPPPPPPTLGPMRLGKSPAPSPVAKPPAAPPPPPPSRSVPLVPSLSTGIKSAHVPPPPPPSAGRGKASLGPAIHGRGRVTTPSSNAATKKASLRPLHWVKVTRAMQGSLWADSEKQENQSRAPEIDISELESLFSAASSETTGTNKIGGRRGSSINKPEKVQLIDLRRAYNCEIMLTKIKIPLPDMINAILALDSSALDIDQVENLIKFCPIKEEMEVLKNYAGDKEMLGKCEKFFLELMKVPRVEAKLRVFAFKITFSSQVEDLRSNLNTINDASREVKESVKLRQIMQTILTLGNALNQGTARGSAVGFKLDSLLKLSDTRAKNNKMTLMHYLCKLLAEKMPELLVFDKDLAHLEAASKIQLKTLAEEMQAVSKGLEKVEQELTTSEHDGPISVGFQKVLKDFLDTAEAEVRALISLYSEVGRNADSLSQYFGEDPARCPFEQVTQILVVFTKMFRKSREENERQAEAEKKKLEKEALKKEQQQIYLEKKMLDVDNSKLKFQLEKFG